MPIQSLQMPELGTQRWTSANLLLPPCLACAACCSYSANCVFDSALLLASIQFAGNASSLLVACCTALLILCELRSFGASLAADFHWRRCEAPVQGKGASPAA